MKSRMFISFSQKINSMQSKRTTLVPSLLISGSLIEFYLWQTQPYSKVFPHTTISEYVIKRNYFHSIFLSPLSFQTPGHLLVYGPAMLYSFYLASSAMRVIPFTCLYLTNALVTASVTIFYERRKNESLQIPLMSPKCVGAVTPLAFMSALLAMNPTQMIFKQIPYFLIPVIYYMYEIQEYQNGYVNEICRPAHLASCVYGLLFGLVFKRII